MARCEAKSRSQKPLQSGFWLKPDPSAAFEAAKAGTQSRPRSRLLTSPIDATYNCTVYEGLLLTSLLVKDDHG
jgi:hypothetical protein